jgi:tetratricopeptide (TPR) repeat protein
MRASHRTFLLLALLGTAAAVPASAQSAQPSAPLSTYPVCNGKPTQNDTDAAHGAYMAGKGSFDEADYTTALNYFKDAYRRDCTKPELLVIIARAYELKGDKREAVHALETYLERAPNAPDAEVQKRRMANLKREMADAPPPPVTAAPPPSAPPTVAPVVTAAPTASAAPSTPPDSLERHHTAPPWIVVGIGAAALVTGAILVPIGAGKVSDAEVACPSHVCPVGSSSAIDSGNSGRTLEMVGGIAIGVGAAAIAGGLIWHFVERPTPAERTAKPVITPQVAPGYAGLGLAGHF